MYVFDRLLAAALLLLAAPLIVLAALITAYLSGRSPLVAHYRVGRYGRPFWMFKLRTMWGPNETHSSSKFVERLAHRNPGAKQRQDARVCNWFARMCRKYSIDELPQLAHVVMGQMSLVGPRPITHAELLKYYGPAAEEVTQLPPGITGLWQVMGRNRLSYSRRRKLDLFLVRHFGASLYLRILFRTIPCVLLGKNAW